MATTVSDRRTHGLLGEIGITRTLAISATLVVALAVESTLLVKATFLGVIPELVLVVIICLAYLDGPRVGVVSAFFGGLLQDLLLPDAVGIDGLRSLVYVFIAYLVANVRQFTQSESVWTPVVVVGAASAVAEFAYAAMSILFGQTFISLSDTAERVGFIVIYNVLLTPFVFPLVRRVADRFRPEKVHAF